MKVGVVMNPVAGGRRLRRHWPEIAEALTRHFGAFEVRETRHSRDAVSQARDFALSGLDLVIAAGGDGTASEVVDGLLQAEVEVRPHLGILPCGTGVDLARGLGLTPDYAATIHRIAASAGRRVDAGRVAYVDDHGALASRHFVNIASLGLSGATVRSVNADRRKGLGSAKVHFLWRTVVEFLRYRFQQVRITIDDHPPVEARIALVAVCNGKFFGAGMMIAPDADVSDGLFDVVILRAASKARLLLDLRLVYGGRHRGHPAITILRGRSVTVEPLGDAAANAALVDSDGKSPGKIPARFDMLPGALTLRL